MASLGHRVVDAMKITIYSKKDCHLCEEAKQVLKRFVDEYSLEIEEIDINEDKDLFEKYQFEIPVIFLNDRKLFKYRIDEEKLRKAIQSSLTQ